MTVSTTDSVSVRVVAWCLAALLGYQASFVAVSSVPVIERDGRVVFLCTQLGLRAARLPARDEDAPDPAPDLSCPLLVLTHNASSAAPVPALPVAPRASSGLVADPGVRATETAASRRHRIRGPPLFS